MSGRLLAVALAATIVLLGRGSAAAFTDAITVDGNAVTVDAVRAHVAVAPGGVASGGVDDLAVALGFVDAPRSFTPAFTVTNTTGATETVSLSLAGVPQVESAVFAASGAASATLAPGASSAVTLTTSAAAAGRGAGTLRLTVAGLPWLYRDYALTVDAAPVAPATLTATARAAGRIALSWAASPTGDLAGYDVFRSSGDGAFAKLNTTPVTALAYEDAATVDGGSYAYVVRAVSSGSPAFSSLPSPEAQATADATPPPAPAAAYVDNRDAPDEIVGAAEAGATVTAVQTAPAPSGPYTTTAAGTGTYRVAVAAAARNTAVSYTVTARDAAGNTSAPTTLAAVGKR